MKTVSVVVLFALFTMFGETAHSIAAGNDGLMFVGSKEKRGGWLGVSIQDMTPRLARSMDSKTTEGALVSEVVDDSPAEKAGVKDEDIIVEYNGKKITDADDLYAAVRESKPASVVTVVVARKDGKKSLQATVGESPKRELSMTAPRAQRNVVVWNNSEMLGMELRELTEQLGAYFGAPDNHGVLVEQVEEDSKAAKAGFKAGDVITKVGKKTIEDVDDIRRVMYAYDDGEQIDVEVIRKGSLQKLTVEAEEMDDDGIYKFKFNHGPNGFRFKDMDLEDIQLDLHGLDNLIHLERIAPDMDRLKLDLRSLKREIQRNMRDVQRDIKREIRRITSEGAVCS